MWNGIFFISCIYYYMLYRFCLWHDTSRLLLFFFTYLFLPLPTRLSSESGPTLFCLPSGTHATHSAIWTILRIKLPLSTTYGNEILLLIQLHLFHLLLPPPQHTTLTM
jgi:hypothetical protein